MSTEQIVQIIPADGWIAVFNNKNPDKGPYFCLRIPAFALVNSGGKQMVVGVAPDGTLLPATNFFGFSHDCRPSVFTAEFHNLAELRAQTEGRGE
ncbi:hypothetical protein [Candidatus Magnetaquicoccus inordinatus]|uniref:hypothetical protein n=1 Tax=Candidatus Magnetaquicoccus inordinatus TaxID=2496818 RepID=UPI00102CC003|nr:hypothetical protein [Candidatus Magnetaquicoccus inordinatus]